MKVIIEIPKGSRNKYEFDDKDKTLYLDRIIHHPYPQNYGFVPRTIAEDGDPLDVFVVSQEPIHPLTYVSVELAGVVLMDDNGQLDPKLITTVRGDSHIYSPHDIVKFLRSYKKGVEVYSLEDTSVAEYTLRDAFRRWYNLNGREWK